jgi:hypothetical protein
MYAEFFLYNMTVQDEIARLTDKVKEVVEDSNHIYLKGVKTVIDGVSVTFDLIDQGDEYEVYATAHTVEEGSDAEMVLQCIRNALATDEHSSSTIHDSDRVDWMEVRFEADASRIL